MNSFQQLKNKTLLKARGRFSSNIHNPRDPNAERYMCYSFHEMSDYRLREQAWQRHLEWVSKLIIGPPKETPYYSQENLKKQGMVGLYVPIYIFRSKRRIFGGRKTKHYLDKDTIKWEKLKAATAKITKGTSSKDLEKVEDSFRKKLRND